MSESMQGGHPRTRGARSSFYQATETALEIPIKFGSVKSFDGHPIFFCEEGQRRNDRPTLVFCYGIACSTLHWTYQIDYFRQNYHCVWWDYRGHRNTRLPENRDSLSVEVSAQDLRAVLNFLEIESPILLGHSMGVSVVLEYFKDYPQDVKALVLANGTAKRPLETLLGGNFLLPAFKTLSNLEKEHSEIVEKIWKLQARITVIGDTLGRLGFNTALAHPEDIKTYARQIAELHPSVLTRMMDHYQNFDATAWLHRIQVPTQILSGERDLVTPPETQQLLHQLIPQSELFLIEHGSHCSTLDLPQLVSLVIDRFLQKLP